MELPFSLHFIKKVEAYQVLKKLDKKSRLQIKDFDGTIPTWEVEKKILTWTYQGHKHLGTPVLLLELESRKHYSLEKLGFNPADQKIVEDTPVDVFEIEYINLINHEYTNECIKASGKKKEDMCITALESDNVGIEETFGNLVSKGYAKYYPEMTDMNRRSFNNDDQNYLPTTQDNFEGILITKEGLLMGEILNDVFSIKKISDSSSDLSIEYRKIAGATFFLYKNLYSFFYDFLIFVSYVALFLIIFIILKEAWQQILHPILHWIW